MLSGGTSISNITLQLGIKLQLPCTSSFLLQSWPQIELSDRAYLASAVVTFMVISSANIFYSMLGCYVEPLGKQGHGNRRFPLLSWRQTQILQVLSLAAWSFSTKPVLVSAHAWENTDGIKEPGS